MLLAFIGPLYIRTPLRRWLVLFWGPWYRRPGISGARVSRVPLRMARWGPWSIVEQQVKRGRESLCWRTEPQGKCKWWILVVSSCTVVIMFRLHFSWVTIGCVVGRTLCVSRSEPQEKANDKTLLVKRLIGDRVDGSSSQLCPLVAGKRRFIASSLESRTW